VRTLTHANLSAMAARELQAHSTPASWAERSLRPRFIFITLGAWALLALLTRFAIAHPRFPGDLPIARWVQSVDWSLLGAAFPIMDWLAGAAGTPTAIAVIACAALVNWRSAPFAIVVEGGASGTYSVLNQWLKLPRPTSDLVKVLVHPSGFGWPSGHAGFALTQVGVIVLCIAGPLLPRRALYAVAAAGALVVAAFCIQRVYVGAHWPSQALGGLVVGTCWLTLGLSIRALSDPVVTRLARRGTFP
jgi:membrane-associated phospholipid phosphatase